MVVDGGGRLAGALAGVVRRPSASVSGWSTTPRSASVQQHPVTANASSATWIRSPENDIVAALKPPGTAITISRPLSQRSGKLISLLITDVGKAIVAG